MRDWYVDGHYVRAATEQDAYDEVLEFYGHHAELVRPWTDEDEEN